MDEDKAGSEVAAADVPLWRLYLLRALYLFIVVGLGAMIWPTLLSHNAGWPLMNSVVSALLAGVSVLSLIGLRYPLKMLPILMFEFVWKAIWLLAVALPLWSAGALDERAAQSVIDCLVGVVLVPIAMPWRYVWSEYVVRPGERWRARAEP